MICLVNHIRGKSLLVVAYRRSVSTSEDSDVVESSGTPLEGLEHDLGWAIGVLSRSYRRAAMSAVQDLPGGPRGYHVLSAVAVGDPSSQLELAGRLGINKSVMTYLIDDLEEAAMVTRRPDPADRRARQVVITTQGARALTRAREQVSAAEAKLLADLSAEEARTLRDLMRRLTVHRPPGDEPDAPSECD
jgi:DNA-binding MarR family transcriptional regulator